MACPRPLGQQGPEPAPSCSSHTQPGSVSRLQAYNQKPPLTRQRPRGSWVCLHAEGWFWLHPFRQSTWGVQVLLFKSVQHPGVWTAPPPLSCLAPLPLQASQAPTARPARRCCRRLVYSPYLLGPGRVFPRIPAGVPRPLQADLGRTLS